MGTMVIVGLGVDLADPARLERLFRSRGRIFLGRWFSPEEAAACALGPGAAPLPGMPAEAFGRLAAIFAAKEAVVKAVDAARAPLYPRGAAGAKPAAWAGPLRYGEALISGAFGEARPRAALTGGLAAFAREAGVLEIELSLSSRGGRALALALALGRAGGDGDPPRR